MKKLALVRPSKLSLYPMNNPAIRQPQAASGKKRFIAGQRFRLSERIGDHMILGMDNHFTDWFCRSVEDDAEPVRLKHVDQDFNGFESEIVLSLGGPAVVFLRLVDFHDALFYSAATGLHLDGRPNAFYLGRACRRFDSYRFLPESGISRADAVQNSQFLFDVGRQTFALAVVTVTFRNGWHITARSAEQRITKPKVGRRIFVPDGPRLSVVK